MKVLGVESEPGPVLAGSGRSGGEGTEIVGNVEIRWNGRSTLLKLGRDVMDGTVEHEMREPSGLSPSSDLPCNSVPYARPNAAKPRGHLAEPDVLDGPRSGLKGRVGDVCPAPELRRDDVDAVPSLSQGIGLLDEAGVRRGMACGDETDTSHDFPRGVTTCWS